MYWGQVAVALAVSFAAASILHSRGRSLFVVALVAIVAYIGIRWAVAWIYRARYWYRRGSTVSKTRNCPECGGYINRRGGDWILTCHRCGWTAGWPVLRWVTRSVPAKQLRRTVVGPQLVIVIAAVVIVTTGAVSGVAMPHLSIPDPNIPDADDVAVQNSTSSNGAGPDAEPADHPTQTLTATEDASDADVYDQTLVIQYFLEYLNEEREDRGLQALTHRQELTEMGNVHSAKMAEHGDIFHEWPDGTTIEERYDARGLLPECRLPIEGSESFYPGAENAAQTWVEQNLVSGSESEYLDSERDIARHLFEMWMDSRGHREAMLVYSADEAGLGLNITSSGELFAALELC